MCLPPFKSCPIIFFKVFEMVSGKYLNRFRETVISPKELIRRVSGTQLVSHLHTHWHALWNKDTYMCTYRYRWGHYCIYSVDLVAAALPPFGFITLHLTKSLALKQTETTYALRAHTHTGIDTYMCTYRYRWGHYCIYSVDLVAAALPPFSFIKLHLTKSLALKLTETTYALRAPWITCKTKRNLHNLHIEFSALFLPFF